MRHPRAANARAIPSPMPLVDPVTSATFFSKTGYTTSVTSIESAITTITIKMPLLLLLL